MKSQVKIITSLAFITILALLFQNCGDGFEINDNTSLSSGPGYQDDESSTPPPTLACTDRSPLRNELKSLSSTLDSALVLENFPLSAETSVNCTLSMLPDTRFNPPTRATTAFRTYMDNWSVYSGNTMRAADSYVRLPLSSPLKSEIANCVLDHLYQLSQNRIFSEPVDSYTDNQGEYERTRMLVSFNGAFHKIKNQENLPIDKFNSVRTWLTATGNIVLNKFEQHIQGRPQNIKASLYWAGVNLMFTGLNTSNTVIFNRGLDFIKMGLDQITAQGLLPQEMSPSAEAFRHHVYALQPLMFAAQIAKLNNIDLFSYRNGALNVLAQMMVNSFRDFTTFQSLTTVAQTYMPDYFLTTNKWDLVWMEIYFSHTGEVMLTPYLKALRPLSHNWIGNGTYLYGLKCLERD